MTECSHWSPRDLGPGWAHLCSVLKMAKTCLLDMKPFSTSRILRLSRGSMYFFSFSWWRKGRGQLWWTLPQGPWPTSNASHVARSPQMNLPGPSPPRSPDPATLASDSLSTSQVGSYPRAFAHGMLPSTLNVHTVPSTLLCRGQGLLQPHPKLTLYFSPWCLSSHDTAYHTSCLSTWVTGTPESRVGTPVWFTADTQGILKTGQL